VFATSDGLRKIYSKIDKLTLRIGILKVEQSKENMPLPLKVFVA
jgi:hypothetical protein